LFKNVFALRAQKIRTNSAKKYLRQTYTNFAPKIWSFRGNPDVVAILRFEGPLGPLSF